LLIAILLCQAEAFELPLFPGHFIDQRESGYAALFFSSKKIYPVADFIIYERSSQMDKRLLTSQAHPLVAPHSRRDVEQKQRVIGP
jgi:hypothetical protein